MRHNAWCVGFLERQNGWINKLQMDVDDTHCYDIAPRWGWVINLFFSVGYTHRYYMTPRWGWMNTSVE
jgi:hypothetical protein